MRAFRNLPLKHKLTVLTMTISGAALLLACLAFVLYEQSEFRRTMASDLAVLADVFDENVAAGLAFNDPATVAETLQTLGANRRIVAACVYDRKGDVVSSYLRPGAGLAADFQFPAMQS